MTVELQILAVTGIKEVTPDDDIAQLILDATDLYDNDCVVITQKIVSKAEGQLVAIHENENSDSNYRQLVENECRKVLRRRGSLVIAETKHGFVCANAGVDRSNVTKGYVTLLPADSDYSAHKIRENLKLKAGVEVGVVISDTFGRPWRRGVTDVGIGCAGIAALVDLRGTDDALGRKLQTTEVAVADEIAAAADLVMGKASGVPIAVLRGLDEHWFREGSVADEIIRSPSEDLFR